MDYLALGAGGWDLAALEFQVPGFCGDAEAGIVSFSPACGEVVPALLWFCAVPGVICLLFLLAGILVRLSTSLELGSGPGILLQSHQNQNSAESPATWGDS